MTISTRKAVKIFLVIDLQPCNTNYSTPRGYVPRRARIPLFILKGNIVSVSKYFMLRPSSLDWDFIEKHYPNYYRSNAILKSDDMSYCLGDMGDVPRDTVITEESYEAFEEYAEDLAYRVENGFADFIGSGLTFGQTADYFDDWLYAVAVLEGEGCIQVSEAVRLWAEKIYNTPSKERRQWYTGRLSSDPKPSLPKPVKSLPNRLMPTWFVSAVAMVMLLQPSLTLRTDTPVKAYPPLPTCVI